jgi:hypothetical protein
MVILRVWSLQRSDGIVISLWTSSKKSRFSYCKVWNMLICSKRPLPADARFLQLVGLMWANSNQNPTQHWINVRTQGTVRLLPLFLIIPDGRPPKIC